MDVADLLKRAEAHKAHNLKVEQTKGTGYHDLDTDPTDRSRQVAPQHHGLPRLSEHVIAFFDFNFSDAVYFVGGDAARVLAALRAWCQKHAPKSPYDEIPGTHRKLLKFVPRLALGSEPPELVLRLSEWNDYLYALDMERVGVTGAPLEADGTTP